MVFNIELSLIIGVITSFVLGFLLLLIKVPQTEYSGKIARTKNTIAVCFMVCSLLFYLTLRYSGIPDYAIFSSMMLFVVTAISSAVLSYSLINLLDESYIENDKFYLNVGVVVAMSFLLMKSFWWEEKWLRIAVVAICIGLFIVQCIVHIIMFNKVYKASVKQLELYYDEEEDQKLKWIRFCYVIMMLTQMFILVYLLLPNGLMKVYAAFYSLFMLYFSANFISFLGSHKLILDAFAYKTLSGQDLMQKISENRRRGGKNPHKELSAEDFNEAEFRRLERALDKWVEQKKFREYDKSREDIAQELQTTKEVLHLYFVTKMGMDFKTWRTELRVNEAKRLLLESKDLSINIIGEMSGFSDRSNFHRQFVKIVGCSPKQWRDSDGNPDLVS
ncbi:MAG: helix-turn-helix domain-containing protein [Candidatus Cryptobacteroides sp.]